MFLKILTWWKTFNTITVNSLRELLGYIKRMNSFLPSSRILLGKWSLLTSWFVCWWPLYGRIISHWSTANLWDEKPKRWGKSSSSCPRLLQKNVCKENIKLNEKQSSAPCSWCMFARFFFFGVAVPNVEYKYWNTEKASTMKLH